MPNPKILTSNTNLSKIDVATPIHLAFLFKSITLDTLVHISGLVNGERNSDCNATSEHDR